MRRWISASVLGLALAASGCRYNRGPDDYCGPTYWNGVPVLGFCERHNSMFSPGTFSTGAVLDGEEWVSDEGIPEEALVLEPVDELPSEPESVETAPRPLAQRPPRDESRPTPTLQQWQPASKTPSASSPHLMPSPVRTTRIE